MAKIVIVNETSLPVQFQLTSALDGSDHGEINREFTSFDILPDPGWTVWITLPRMSFREKLKAMKGILFAR